MKKFIIVLLPLFLIVFSKALVFAQDSGSGSAMISPKPMMVDYVLPYPGILPDNPLYVLKVIRDNIVIFFIADPLKKSTFYLLQSDKRLLASLYLLKKDSSKQDLAFSTLSKSTNYFDQAVSSARLAKNSGENVNDLLKKLHDSGVKHLAVESDMLVLQGIRKNSIQTEQGRLKNILKIVSGFSSN